MCLGHQSVRSLSWKTHEGKPLPGSKAHTKGDQKLDSPGEVNFLLPPWHNAGIDTYNTGQLIGSFGYLVGWGDHRRKAAFPAWLLVVLCVCHLQNEKEKARSWPTIPPRSDPLNETLTAYPFTALLHVRANIPRAMQVLLSFLFPASGTGRQFWNSAYTCVIPLWTSCGSRPEPKPLSCP